MFCERLRRLRSARGISHPEFARRISVAQHSVWNWEAGAKKPRLDAVASIARELHVSTDYLLTGREAPNYAALVAALRRTTTDPRVLALVEGR